MSHSIFYTFSTKLRYYVRMKSKKLQIKPFEDAEICKYKIMTLVWFLVPFFVEKRGPDSKIVLKNVKKYQCQWLFLFSNYTYES